MNKANNRDTWSLISEGAWGEAIDIISADIERKPDSALYCNRGCCYLGLQKYDEAYSDFLTAIVLEPGGAYYATLAGCALWCQGKRSDAIREWQQVIGAKYNDAAGGVIVPLLLLFGSSIVQDDSLKEDMYTLLEDKWYNRTSTVWPCPITGYIIGAITLEQFAQYAELDVPDTSIRVVFQAQFWIAVRKLLVESVTEFSKIIETALAKVPKDRLGSFYILPEYWLSIYEYNNRYNVLRSIVRF